MDEEKKVKKKKKKRVNPVRQSWKPHWIIGLLYRLWRLVFGAAKIVIGAAATVGIICVICALVFVSILGDYLQEDILPNSETDMSTQGMDLNSFAYYTDSNGQIQLLQNIFSSSDREWVDYEDIPEDMIHATVAIEDKRFFEHQGVDWITTMKACFFMFFGNGDRGGSTITQQLIKNITQEDSYTVQRKVSEIFKAVQLEKTYDKETILERYLNEIYMGNGCNGIKTAAATYFGKELEKLTVAECASLISITNNPSLYNPYRENLDKGGLNGAQRNRERQMDTLNEMKDQGWITEAEYEEAVAQEMVFKNGIADEDRIAVCEEEGCGYRDTVSTYNKEGDVYYCPNCGSVAEIGVNASQEVYSWFMDAVIEDVASDLARLDGLEPTEDNIKWYEQLISKRGYHIYTTLDMEVQNAIDKIYTNLDEIPKTRSSQQLQSGIVIIDNSTGYIVGISGGVGEKNVHDGWSCATDAEVQTGSSIKPISVYAPAFETGTITPATVVKDMPLRYDGKNPWPKNSDRTYIFSTTIHNAIKKSINACAVNTLDIIGTGYSFNFAKEKFGVDSLLESYVMNNGELRSDMDFAPLGLGAQTIGVTVREMANAFAVFANDGQYRTGITYTKVLDRNGNLVLSNEQETRSVLGEKALNYINDCLYDATRSGTGTEARIDGQNVYGKTGTTASNKDRWYCGYTGYYTAAVWCGYNRPEEIHVSGNPAAQLFKKVMTQLHEGKDKVSLVDSGKLKQVEICMESGLIATEDCKLDIRAKENLNRVDKVKLYREDIPEDTCNKHVSVTYCTEGHGVATEYCSMFAEAEAKDKMLEKVSLVKVSEADLEAILKAEKKGMSEWFFRDDYIYLVKKDGTPANFKGLKNDKNKDVDAPYIVCTLHTKDAWDAYQATTNPTEPVDPNAPADPNAPTDAVVPPVTDPESGAVG